MFMNRLLNYVTVDSGYFNLNFSGLRVFHGNVKVLSSHGQGFRRLKWGE